jgi:hypothetical protein
LLRSSKESELPRWRTLISYVLKPHPMSNIGYFSSLFIGAHPVLILTSPSLTTSSE